MSEHDTTTQATDEPTTEETAEQPEDQQTEESTGKVGRLEALETEGEIAADYLEELLDIADLDGDLDMDVEGDRASVSIVGADLNQLVGRDGEVLAARDHERERSREPCAAEAHDCPAFR